MPARYTLRMQCAKRDELRNRAVHILGALVRLGNEQVDCIRAEDYDCLMKIDKDLELQFGEKERAFGALREHIAEHRCS
jgi:hypothetical protein